jgi:hypothetical protein
MSSCFIAAAAGFGGGAGDDGDGGGGGGGDAAFAMAGGGSAVLASGRAAGFGSSSAMILRIDARISSIEGSCALAACVIRRFLQSTHRPARRESAEQARNMRGFAELWQGQDRRRSNCLWTEGKPPQ